MCAGEPVEFEFSSADASSAAVLVMRSSGLRASRALAANERLIIHGFSGVIAAGANPTKIIGDADADGNVDAGELMAVLGTGVNNMADMEMAGEKGAMPKVKAAGAGQVDIAGWGVVVTG